MRFALATLLVVSFAAQAAGVEQDTVSVTAINAEIREPTNGAGDGVFTSAFTISRGSGITGDLVVNITVGGTAAGADYRLTLDDEVTDVTSPGSDQVTIPDGESSITLRLAPRDDTTPEGRRTVILGIAESGGGSGSYLRGSGLEATVVLADNDLVLGWSIIRNGAAEDLKGAMPPEAAVRLSFYDVNNNPLDGTDLAGWGITDLRAEFRLLDGSAQAALNTDYFMTMMYRHAGSAGSSILDARSVSLGTGSETWTLGTKVADVDMTGADAGSVEEGDDIVPVNGHGMLQVGDVIAFGTESSRYYVIQQLIAATTPPAPAQPTPPAIRLDRGLDVAVTADTPIRNNVEVVIVANNSILGIPMSDDYFQVDLALTPKYDAVAEGAELITMQLLSSPDYIVKSPNDLELTLAEDDILAYIEAIDDANRATDNAGTLRVNLTSPAPRSLVIPIEIASGAGYAVPGVDYVALATSITIPSGSSSYDIEVVPLGGSGVDTVQISLVDTADIRIAGSGPSKGQTATVFVRDGVSVAGFGAVTIASHVASTSDEDAAATPAAFAVSIARSGDDNPEVTVPILVGGSAIPGVDYTELSASVVIPRLVVGATAAADASFISLRTESGSVTLPSGTPLRIGTDATVRTLGADTTVSTTAAYAPLTAVVGSLVNAGTTVGVNRVIVPVTAIVDDLAEGSETVSVTLLRASTTDNYTLGATTTAQVGITDTAAPPVDPGDDDGGSSNPKPAIGSGSGGSSGCGAGAASALLMGAFAVVALRRRRR